MTAIYSRANWVYAIALLCSLPAHASDVCPAGRPARSIDVFDGTPDEHMDLEADDGNRQRGYFVVKGVYDRGRFVTIRCIFADNTTSDIKLADRANICEYRYDKRRNIQVDCHL